MGCYCNLLLFFPQCPIAQGDLSRFLSYYTHFGHVMNTKEAYIIDDKMHIYVMPPF
jgi:hypothetical protein